MKCCLLICLMIMINFDLCFEQVLEVYLHVMHTWLDLLVAAQLRESVAIDQYSYLTHILTQVIR